MAMDLLLGNLGREPWGWADPDTLFFLEYWRTLDPESVFIMVYDGPASVIREHGFDAPEEHQEASMRKHLDNWFAYNSAMLRFYFRNIERCVLIHSRQLQGDAEYCLEEIQAKLSALLDMTQPTSDGCAQSALLSATDPELALSAAKAGIPATMLCAESPTARFLIECQLERYPHHRVLYDELQAAANLPLEREENALGYSISAWISWLQERNAVIKGIKRMGLRCRENETTLNRLRSDHQLSLLQHEQACEELAASESAREKAQTKVAEQIALQKFFQQQVNDLHVQLTASESAREKAQTKISEQIALQQSYQQQVNDLQAQLAHILDKNQKLISASAERSAEFESDLTRLREDLRLTVLQHGQACEEIRQLANENLRLRIELQILQTPAAEPAAESETPPPTGAAERVKNQLSYRLGSLLVTKAKNPFTLVVLPMLLVLETLRFHREKRVRPTEHQPPIQEYADAVLAAEVKKQLPYRLGNTLVRRSKSPFGWVILPFAFIRQIQAFHRNRRTDA
jgi:hypothetical protein